MTKSTFAFGIVNEGTLNCTSEKQPQVPTQKHKQFITAEDMDNTMIGDLRSAELQTNDKQKLKSLIKRSRTQTAAAKALGMSRDTLRDMLKSGSCHPKTLQKVRKYFEENIAA